MDRLADNGRRHSIPRTGKVMRNLGHRMVDDMLSWLETVRERKVWAAGARGGEG